jgi:hypothetical protein
MSNTSVTLCKGRKDRTQAYIIGFTTVLLHKHTYTRNIISWYNIKNDMPQKYHKWDLNVHNHPLIHSTVCCAAGMLMCQHPSPINLIRKMQNLITKIKKTNLLLTKNQSGKECVSQSVFHVHIQFIPLSPVTGYLLMHH